jgi:hypothetical protein
VHLAHELSATAESRSRLHGQQKLCLPLGQLRLSLAGVLEELVLGASEVPLLEVPLLVLALPHVLLALPHVAEVLLEANPQVPPALSPLLASLETEEVRILARLATEEVHILASLEVPLLVLALPHVAQVLLEMLEVVPLLASLEEEEVESSTVPFVFPPIVLGPSTRREIC